MRKLTILAVAALALCLAASASAAGDKKLKMRIAVAPIDWSNHSQIDDWEIPVEIRNAIYEKLVQKLLDTGKFVVLERDAMNALLTEKGIKEENTGQSQKGKIVPAQALIKGAMTDFELNSKGGGGGVSIGGTLGSIGVGGHVSEAKVGMNVRMFDVDTSELLASESASKSVQAKGFTIRGNINSVGADYGAYEKTPLGEATTKALDMAVEKILAKLGKTPWQASVADWDDKAKEITMNAGSDLGVEVGDVFEVYKVTKVIKDPETGEVLGKKMQKSGTIKVTSVEKKFAIASAIDGSDYTPGDVIKEIVKDK